ncbi:hypothetical protein [Alkalicoccus urumqiensis]|uniref:Uncharacterized protein n=1 Tax=Alkalicoccus urumqiensis TaxID=1548213 RepID=A0A2P6MED1_ALKUR|nr:hypothetical protein [Alkalicoccus urumqiensis]PRO64610.1 hypothetical protein C6I21_14030 [Alkalicoccus urumqiensis]
MDIQQFYRKKAKTHLLLAGISTAGSLILLAALYILNWPSFQYWNSLLFIPAGIPIALGMSLAAKRRAGRIQLTVPDTPAVFTEQRRMILVPFVHWLKEYVYFTMKGEAVVLIREDTTGLKKAGTFLLHLIGLRRYLRKRLLVSNQQGILYRLYKDAGWKQRYHLYEEASGEEIGSYDMNLWNVKRQYSTLYDGEGHRIGENEGGFTGIHFQVLDEEKEKCVDIKFDGIPLEAMNLFGGVRGDIVTARRDLGSHTPVYLLAPLIVELHYTRS